MAEKMHEKIDSILSNLEQLNSHHDQLRSTIAKIKTGLVDAGKIDDAIAEQSALASRIESVRKSLDQLRERVCLLEKRVDTVERVQKEMDNRCDQCKFFAR